MTIKKRIRQTMTFKIGTLLIPVVLALSMAACEGPQGPEGSQGPEGPQGQQGPQGPEGNANVTLYIFDGHDFTSSSVTRREIHDVTETEMEESKWDVYLKHTSGWYYHLSGYGINDATMYFTAHRWNSAADPMYADFWVEAADGGGEVYEEIRIIRTAANSTVDNTSSKAASPILENLDFSNYREVEEYYNLDEKDAVYISSH